MNPCHTWKLCYSLLKILVTLLENQRKPTELPTAKFRRKFLPTDIISSPNLSVYIDRYHPSAIRSVYTDGICSSVHTDRIADRLHSFFGKLQRCDDMDFFRRFYRWNDRGIQTVISV